MCLSYQSGGVICNFWGNVYYFSGNLPSGEDTNRRVARKCKLWIGFLDLLGNWMEKNLISKFLLVQALAVAHHVRKPSSVYGRSD